MPGDAVFGDFLAAANRHLEAATLAGGNPVGSPADVARDLYQLVTVLSRYCDDLAPCDQVEASGRNDLRPWEHTAIDAGDALRIAADCLRHGADSAASGQPGTMTAHEAEHLAAAARELAAGRDLLHTHLATDPDGLMRGRSEWAPAVTSMPVTRALANEITRWARLLAPFTAGLASSAALGNSPYEPGQLPGPARAELSSASQWLHIAGAAARPALDADPVRTTDAELLSAIPTTTVPPRRRPGSTTESITELCHGITISSSRLRRAMQDSEDRARWSPSVTSGGWQWMAQAAAITSHLSELALRAVGTRASQFASPPVNEPRLNSLADLMTDVRAAWSQVDRAWDAIITETRLLPTPAMTDASDLLLRMGRLNWDDPQWTPARSHRAPSRTPAALAPDPATARTILAAVHHSVDALAYVAKAEIDAVKAAERAGRLFVPRRSLPERSAETHPFVPAPADQCQALLAAYHAAQHASLQAALALDGLAVGSRVPSTVLALARAAAAQPSRPRGRSRHPSDVPTTGSLPADPPFRHSRASTGMAGLVEQAIRDRQVSDPVTLLRAAAIDNAAHQLVAQADGATPTSISPDTPKKRQRTAPNAAQLAAQNFPYDVSTRPLTGQPSRPAERTSSASDHRVRRQAQ